MWTFKAVSAMETELQRDASGVARRLIGHPFALHIQMQSPEAHALRRCRMTWMAILPPVEHFQLFFLAQPRFSLHFHNYVPLNCQCPERRGAMYITRPARWKG